MKKHLIAFTLLGIATLACSIPVQINVEQPNPALTVELVYETTTPLYQSSPVSQTDMTLTQSASGQVINSPSTQINSTPVSTATQITTSTPSVTTVAASQDTNCRNGPGLQFDITGQLLIGETAEVVGKNTSTNYWIIKKPGSSTTCWLWGKYATVSGDQSGLSEMQIPPTPTFTATKAPTPTATKIVLQPPAAPSNLSETNICAPAGPPDTHYASSGTLTWQDNSDNEDGFNIYWIDKNIGGSKDWLIGTVGPNTTSFGFSQGHFNSSGAFLKVEAFNSAGASNRVSVNVIVNCPQPHREEAVENCE